MRAPDDNRHADEGVASSLATRVARSPRLCLAVGTLGLLAVLPLIAVAASQPYYITLLSRVVIMALAAAGLNIILSYGGLISFGHSLYIGFGAYAVGILSAHGISNGYVHLFVALSAGAVISSVVGAVSLRASGIAFIMITLAFAQMFYLLAISLERYGGEDGFRIAARSDFVLLDLDRPLVLYYAAYFVLLGVLFLSGRLIESRFGMILRGTKSNETRLIALGLPTVRFKLIAYVISALVCVIAGMLLANLTKFVSPSYLQWSVSGELIVMIVLGGLGTLVGPVVGAVTVLLLETVLSSLDAGLPANVESFIKLHWLAVLGIVIVCTTLFFKRGLYGSLRSTEGAT